MDENIIKSFAWCTLRFLVLSENLKCKTRSNQFGTVNPSIEFGPMQTHVSRNINISNIMNWFHEINSENLSGCQIEIFISSRCGHDFQISNIFPEKTFIQLLLLSLLLLKCSIQNIIFNQMQNSIFDDEMIILNFEISNSNFEMVMIVMYKFYIINDMNMMITIIWWDLMINIIIIPGQFVCTLCIVHSK